MRQTRGEIDQHLAERWCWPAARRDDARVARRLYRKPGVDGVDRLDAGALLDDFFSFLQQLGVVDWLNDVRSTAIQRERVPVVQYVLLYRLKTLFGVDRMQALPPLWCSDEALRRLVGFNAQQVRQGVCQRGAATRQGPRTAGPIGPDTLAEHSVPLHVRDLEVVCNGVIRALAKSGVLAAKVTGLVDATDLETTAPYEGCGQGRAARTERLETAVVGIVGLTTDDQEGTPEHGRHHNRRDCSRHMGQPRCGPDDRLRSSWPTETLVWGFP